MRSWMRLAAVVMAGSLAGKASAQTGPAPAKPEAADRARIDRDVAEYQFDRAQVEQRKAVAAYILAGARAKIMTEKAAYLGTGVSPVIPAVREQMKLVKGVGLVVDKVEPGSPAETAGIKQNDILEKFNDQLLVNLQQLTVLVRATKGGDEIKLTIIREGEHQTVPVKLVEKEVPALDENINWPAMAAGASVGYPAPPRARTGGMTAWAGGDAELTVGGPRGDFTTRVRVDGVQDQAFDDGKIAVRVRTQDGSRALTATDKATGNVLFDGKINDDAARNALPAAVADVLKKLDEVAAANQGRIIMPGGDRLIGRANGLTLIAPQNTQNRRLPRIPSTKLDAITWSDEEHTFDVTASKVGEKRELHLVAKNAEGTIVFDGPINTDDEKKGLPKDIAEKFSSLAVAQVLDVMRGNAAGIVDPVKPGAPRPVLRGGLQTR